MRVRLHRVPTEEQKQRLYECAKTAGKLGDGMLHSHSGADQADSEVYFCARRVYVAVSEGTSVDEAIELEDRRWRAYTEEQRKKVDAAPKIKHGPSSGQSVIAHRWVSPERFRRMENHIRFMVRHALGEEKR